MTSRDTTDDTTTVDVQGLDALFSSRPGTSDAGTLDALLKSWCSDHECKAAALYSPGGDARLAMVGEIDFPERAPEPTEGPTGRRLSLPGGGVVLHDSDRDVDESRRSQKLVLGAVAAVCGMKRRLQEQNLQAMSQGVELVALYEVGLAIASILDIEELAEEVLSKALMLIECSLGALYTLDDDGYRLACSRGTAEQLIAAADLHLDALKKSGGRPDIPILRDSSSMLAVSVEAEGRPRGLLVVGHGTGDTERTFTPKDRSTLSLFANQAAIALEQARLHRTALEKERLDREMELAAEIQQELLPDEMPSIPGFEVLGWNRPALHVGGDYFGFHPLDGGRWALVLGDVSGKGAPAALLVSTLDSALRVLLGHLGVGPDLIERLNSHVFESSGAHKFITLVVAALDPTNGAMTYLNAGHNPGLLLRSNGSVQELESGGPPVGMLSESSFAEGNLELGEGDLVCFYSDGITECAAPDDEEYEIERLTTLLGDHQHEPLEKILEAVDRAMVEFAAGQPQGDDQTVILLRRSTAS